MCKRQVFSVYSTIDQAVTLTYQKEGYTDTENDLENLIGIVNKTDLTKTQIKNELKDHKLYEYMDLTETRFHLTEFHLYSTTTN